MKRVSQKELDDMQSMIDSVNGKTPSPEPDSNTAAQGEAEKFLGAMGMADEETKRRAKLRKIAGQ